MTLNVGKVKLKIEIKILVLKNRSGDKSGVKSEFLLVSKKLTFSYLKSDCRFMRISSSCVLSIILLLLSRLSDRLSCSNILTSSDLQHKVRMYLEIFRKMRSNLVLPSHLRNWSQTRLNNPKSQGPRIRLSNPRSQGLRTRLSNPRSKGPRIRLTNLRTSVLSR
jgi:hypothetical protein